MKILFATSEAVPFCKTGGLADVAGSLPQALAQAVAAHAGGVHVGGRVVALLGMDGAARGEHLPADGRVQQLQGATAPWRSTSCPKTCC